MKKYILTFIIALLLLGCNKQPDLSKVDLTKNFLVIDKVQTPELKSYNAHEYLIKWKDTNGVYQEFRFRAVNNYKLYEVIPFDKFVPYPF